MKKKRNSGQDSPYNRHLKYVRRFILSVFVKWNLGWQAQMYRTKPKIRQVVSSIITSAMAVDIKLEMSAGYVFVLFGNKNC